MLWRLRYKLSLRDLVEMFLERGFEFTHEAVRDWETRFAPLIAQQLRRRRRGKAGQSWYVDETYVRVGGVKQRYYPMRGFGSFDSASRFCQAYDEQRQYFRYRSKPKETIPLAEQRQMFRQRFGALQNMLMAAK